MIAFRLVGRVGAFELAIDASSPAGLLGLIGPNGSGKTTALSMLLGVIAPSAGRVEIAGAILFDAERAIDVPVEERLLGYVPQGYRLFPHLTVRENVAYGVRGTRAERLARASETLAELEIPDALADRRPEGLSGGEAQRVALARALAPRPRALLLDEPLAALDVSTRRRTRDVLAATLRKLALPAIIVTHDPDDARALTDHVAVIDRGRTVQQGSIAELLQSPASPFVREFLTASR